MLVYTTLGRFRYWEYAYGSVDRRISSHGSILAGAVVSLAKGDARKAASNQAYISSLVFEGTNIHRLPSAKLTNVNGREAAEQRAGPRACFNRTLRLDGTANIAEMFIQSSGPIIDIVMVDGSLCLSWSSHSDSTRKGYIIMSKN